MLLRAASALDGFVDSYWIYEGGGPIPPVYEFPSLAPELALCVDGRIAFVYRGARYELAWSTLFGHLDGPMRLDLSGVARMVVVRFASRGVSSVLPFVTAPASLLRHVPFLPAREVFGPELTRLERRVLGLAP
ncbi:MAG: hypothetical protein R3362_06775, partial [Rhodothermales bacterium]|nr:hypothetical protein [Rhodothermales bacterium]